MATRLAKAAGHDAIVVAAAALDRLGLAHEIAERLPVELVLPQVGQAALAVECRVDDRELLERLAAVDHPPTHRCVAAEDRKSPRLNSSHSCASRMPSSA